MKFKYTNTMTLDTKGRFIKRPLIELEIVGKDKQVKAFGLIDSGADTTLMNIEYAKRVGLTLDINKSKHFAGISGPSARCYLSRVPVKIKYFDEPVSMAVGFIDSPSVDILLGQEDFFDSFRIKFEKDHDVFELNTSKNRHLRE